MGMPRPRASLVEGDIAGVAVLAVDVVGGVGVGVAVGERVELELGLELELVRAAPAKTDRSELCQRTSIPYPSARVVSAAGTVTTRSLCQADRTRFGV